ncbi:hypothetical protein JOQ06_025650 [Pogonophryne albipinna]|uniref:Uncharacterized protein n=1 Tax=Pogonophryne albipinna TaxID=1090488 RepID=A0AAD6AW61_9TELE|nr:hypothetical protein JOQ06_024967 [Pogonophryne albipinna]KAJ4931353.1 hypothetical protein JOQ06_025650 [Pogonophryne albipinna]
MASTPSASALSAVLRCRGNILTRNPLTKRPASSAYSLGLAGVCPTKRAQSNQPSAWEAFLQGVSGGRSVTVAFKSPRVAGFMSLKLAVFWKSSSIPDDALHQNIKSNDLQTDNHSPSDLTSSKDNSGSGQMVPEDRPD